MTKNIRELINESATKFPDNLAFKVKNKNKEYTDITYTILKKEIESLGKYLLAHGLADKRIAVIGKNSYNWMLVYLSVLAVNGVIVPLDKGLLPYELEDQIERGKIEVIFHADNFNEILREKNDIVKFCMDDSEFQNIIKEGMSLNNDDLYNSIEIDNEKMSLLLFTSGTTSKSKAVMLSQKNIVSNVHSLRAWEKFSDSDINMAILPFHHAFGMTQVVLFLSLGMCNVFCEGLKFAKCLNEYKVTVLVCVPRIIEEVYSMIGKKLKKMNKTKKVETGIKIASILRKLNIDVRRKIFKEIIEGLGGNLRFVIVGAAPAKPEILKWFNDIGILTVQGYGLTETAPVLAAENDTHMRTGTVGLAIPGVDIKIVNPDENGIGEITAKGDNVMSGYYNDPESTTKVLIDGYFHTGDLGYVDKDGYLYITGRKKNVIVLCNGKNVFPEEIETLLCDCDAIKECIVYNNKQNNKDHICAKIVYNTDFSDYKEIIENHVNAVNEKLISYKQIKEYELTDVEMEKTTTLKIKRH